jgi:hypothetical protein
VGVLLLVDLDWIDTPVALPAPVLDADEAALSPPIPGAPGVQPGAFCRQRIAARLRRRGSEEAFNASFDLVRLGEAIERVLREDPFAVEKDLE